MGCLLRLTLFIAPTGSLRDVIYFTTSRSVSVSWSTIECIERNGEITNYTVIFQEQGGAVIPGVIDVVDRTFTASGLSPHTHYTFRVAGVNSNGIGPYSSTIVILTDTDRKLGIANELYVCIHVSFCHTVPGVVSDLTGQAKFTSIVLTWSAPQEPNGVIISYEVTYRVSYVFLVTTNTTDLRFTIPSLTPGTNVTEISVSAYTSVGRGGPALIPDLMTITAPCKKIQGTSMHGNVLCRLKGETIHSQWHKPKHPDYLRLLLIRCHALHILLCMH